METDSFMTLANQFDIESGFWGRKNAILIKECELRLGEGGKSEFLRVNDCDWSCDESQVRKKWSGNGLWRKIDKIKEFLIKDQELVFIWIKINFLMVNY